MVVPWLIGAAFARPHPPPFRANNTMVELKKRVMPTYPEAAKPLEPDDTRCTVDVTVEETGVPEAVEVRDCPEVFHPETKRALGLWRWYPLKIDQVPHPFVIEVGVTYRFVHPAPAPADAAPESP